MSEHTAGPWTAIARGEWEVIAGEFPHQRTVSTTFAIDDEDMANARLIAAAPELLEALERIATYEPASFIAETDITAGDYAYAFGYVQQAAKSALAKIGGEKMNTIIINDQPVEVPTDAIAWKYADPTEEARWIYDDEEAREIEREDPSLIVWVQKER